MDTERPSSGLLGFRCFREDYSQFSHMQEKLRPCHNSCGTRAVVEGLFMVIVVASVSLTALRSGDRWAGISGAYAVWNLFNTLYPQTQPGSALFVITAFILGVQEILPEELWYRLTYRYDTGDDEKPNKTLSA